MKSYLSDRISEALEELGIAEPSAGIIIGKPKSKEHGDLSTNVAMTLSKAAGENPLDLARKISDAISLDKTLIESAEAVPPGFINFRFGSGYRRNILERILNQGDRYGRTNDGKDRRVNVEFVSANPTGPLSVGHGRNAVFGDTVARILKFNGYDVTREYYFNNAGRQMRLLGESVRARYLEELGKPAEFPENGYEGDYIRDIASEMVKEQGDSLVESKEVEPFTRKAEEQVFRDIVSTLNRIGIEMDVFSNEADFYERGEIDDVISTFRDLGLAYDKDGAVWFKTTELGLENDRVIVKSSGEPTYRLPDIAYHRDKFRRGFHRMIDIFGADHHASYPDVLAGLKALGLDSEKVTVLIHQFVTLTKGGEKVKMSTRKATFVTLDELIEETGADVVRYFFLMRGMSSHLNFDLDLAKKESDENPVYYIQYAHARISSILRLAKEQGISSDLANFPLLTSQEENKLMNMLGEFPDTVSTLLRTLEPHHLPAYLTELATAFSRFYVEHRVVTEDKLLSSARLALCKCVRQVLSSGLWILGISAPERM